MTYQRDASPIEANSPQNKDMVVLVHGLYENRWAMKPLAWRLADEFHCHRFCYASVRQDLSQHSLRLARFVERLADTTPHTIHFLAHSLGGLVVRHYLAHHRPPKSLRLGRVVTLGTPHLGSQVAHTFWRLTPKVLGLSYTGALDGTPIYNNNLDLGSIAGNRPLGIGLPILYYHGKQKPHDGTVYVDETKLQDFPHITLAVNHTQLLTSREVALQARHFLCHGCFF